MAVIGKGDFKGGNMKLLPIEGCNECNFGIFCMGVGYACTHPKVIEVLPKSKDRKIDFSIHFRHDCPLEDEK